MLECLCQRFKSCTDDKEFQGYLIKSFAALANYSLPFTLELILSLFIKYEIDDHIGYIWNLLDKSFIKNISFDRISEMFSNLGSFIINTRAHKSLFGKSWVHPFNEFVSRVVASVTTEQGTSREKADIIETKFLELYQAWLTCDPQFTLPWNKTPIETEAAKKLLASFFISMNNFFTLTHQVGMTKLWTFLNRDTGLIGCVPKTLVHVQDVVFDALLESKIEWKDWNPTLEDVEHMTSLTQTLCTLPSENISGGLTNFLCAFACDIRWENQNFSNDYRGPHFMELFMRWGATLLLCNQVQNELKAAMISKSNNMKWTIISTDSYDLVLKELIEILRKVNSNNRIGAGAQYDAMLKFLSTTCGALSLFEDKQEENENANNQQTQVTTELQTNRLMLLTKLLVASLELGLPTQGFSDFVVTKILKECITRNSESTEVAALTQTVNDLVRLFNNYITRDLISSRTRCVLESHPEKSLFMLNVILKEVTSLSILVQECERVITFLLSPSTQAKLHKEGTSQGWKEIIQVIPPCVTEEENMYLEIIDKAVTNGAGLFLFAFTQKLLSENKEFSPEYWITNFHFDPNKEQTVVLVTLSVLEKTCKTIKENPENIHYTKVIETMGETLMTMGLDRKKEGISGFLGLGQPSEYTPSFRLIVRMIGIFVRAQIMDNGKLRMHPEDPRGVNYSDSIKKLKSLTYVLKDKSYISQMRPEVMRITLTEMEHSLENKNTTLDSYKDAISLLVQSIYPNSLELSLALELKE